MGAQGDGPGPSSEAQAARAKGRAAGEIRALLCERSILDRADGSAKWEQDGTCVVAAVHGPRQASMRREDPEKAVVEVVFRPRTGLPGSRERLFEVILRAAVEGVVLTALHPRTSVLVVCQVIHEDGSVLAAALNAACAALVDAGVPMGCLFAAATCAFMPDGNMVLDPDASEEQAAVGTATIAHPHRHVLVPPGASDNPENSQGLQELEVDEGVLTCTLTGRFSAEQCVKALEASRAAAKGLAKFEALSLVSSMQGQL